MPTNVEIDFFKPVGYSDTYVVNTEHRGLAIKTVMARYDEHHLSCINAIIANLCADDGGPYNRPHRKLEPIGTIDAGGL